MLWSGVEEEAGTGTPTALLWAPGPEAADELCFALNDGRLGRLKELPLGGEGATGEDGLELQAAEDLDEEEDIGGIKASLGFQEDGSFLAPDADRQADADIQEIPPPQQPLRFALSTRRGR